MQLKEYLFIGNIKQLELYRMYKVEKIMGKRESTKKKGSFQYLVKWQGWSIKDSTWEPSKNLTKVKDLIQKYEALNSGLLQSKKQKQSVPSVEELETTQKEKRQKRAKEKNIQKAQQMIKTNDVERSTQTISGTEQQKKPKTKRLDKKIVENHNCQKKGDTNTSGGSENSQTPLQSNQSKTQKQQTNVKLLGMKKQGNHFWYYIVEKNGDQSWVVREYVLNNYPISLIEFYEQRIVFSSI